MIIVGTTALKYYGYERSEPKDLDVWLSEGETYEFGRADTHVVPNYVLELIETYGTEFACPDSVYTIKCSHLAWDIKWEKTKNDILWLKSKGCELIPELYYALKKHWEEEHGDKSFLSLKKPKDYFFEDHVKYIYDHDYLHELVAYPNKPMYTKCLKSGEDVLIDKDKFDLLSFEDQVRMFREEIAVIAVERWLVHDNSIGWYKSYMNSLKKTITNLTKNWACDFIIHNLKYFVKPDYNYFSHILKTLKLEDDIMSKVDMSVFEEFMEAGNWDGSVANFVYCLCEGDDFYDFELVDRDNYPDWKEYDKANNSAMEKLFDKFGYEHLDQEGGGEGGSEYCYGVFKLGGKIYKAAYSYYSYNGHEYDYIVDTLREVTPKQKTITVYE